MTNEIILNLKKTAMRRRESGHLWIFSNELENIDTSISAGTICRILRPDGGTEGSGFFNPRSLIAVRLLQKGKTPLNPDFIEERISTALSYRRQAGIEKYCRLVFSESDNLPGLIIDRYGDVFIVEILCAGMEQLKDKITSAIVKLFRPRAVHYRNTSRFRELEGLEIYEETEYGSLPDEISIEENGLNYIIPIPDAQKTGWYYDQRENRAFLEPYFTGRRVLDLHTYLGGFALTAARSGAAQVWGVDSSAKAIEYAEKNALMNGLADRVIFQKAKAEHMLEALEAGLLPEKPDFILLDPPNIVYNKKCLSQGIKMLSKMVYQAVTALPQGGLLAVSTCSNHITRELFTESLAKAAGKTGRTVSLMELRGQAKDHPVILGMPETEYLHFALLRIM